ncbi:prepilin-type N-terminal cleavage/methylation domain-containing protein [Xanthomonadaceae bacterium XH05]|nr:prepilin-type N-terminal cleavage/methylation domain-containing protein [Xanthomonadaceae bacterium XH05]
MKPRIKIPMQQSERGYTMAELMVIVGIIGILVAIALPAWSNHRIRSANSACVTELSAYTLVAVAALHDGVAVPAATAVRCQSINSSAIGTLGVPGVITASAVAPGDATVSCSIAPGASCTHTSASGN